MRRPDVFDALCAQMKKFQHKTNLSADEEFLMMLKEKYSSTDAEWDERQKTRRDQ